MSGTILSDPIQFWLACITVTIIASFVKGAVGFAMPMIMISGLASFLPGDVALGVLIIPTLLANAIQALRGGVRDAWRVVREYWRYLGAILFFISCSAQLVSVLPQHLLLLGIGVPITVFAITQLVGWAIPKPARDHGRIEWIIGSIAGFIGGMSGVWGPPTVAYLTAIDAPKAEAIRVQGVIYGAGAVALALAHTQSGVLNAQTLPLSAAMVIPMLVGMWAGFRVQDRLNQVRFRRAMLVVLVVAGANLIRRGLAGF
ncbi:sulfite exporter TauE/SafE family protein [Qingshengfaniella alkalisoli]|uniref:Probable membrane transporter protein n=1 Tax=Qingshengfaniella alkalisoli TaxID=2599296 RepID=A0A5B8J1V1_9RHOB|nr:sulfite exporter TauE/SafE family protein [Qingshengfaniella alkalisoli]QDY68200.1 sulfite exporter TauE/SafE family protein [Qingshengfaniella alkalisoli]